MQLLSPRKTKILYSGIKRYNVPNCGGKAYVGREITGTRYRGKALVNVKFGVFNYRTQYIVCYLQNVRKHSMNLKGGDSRSLFQVSILAFAFRNWAKLRKISFIIMGVFVEIITLHLPLTCRKAYLQLEVTFRRKMNLHRFKLYMSLVYPI
jgi:hypothetical protein